MEILIGLVKKITGSLDLLRFLFAESLVYEINPRNLVTLFMGDIQTGNEC